MLDKFWKWKNNKNLPKSILDFPFLDIFKMSIFYFSQKSFWKKFRDYEFSRHQKIPWGWLFGCKNLYDFICLTIKFHNFHRTSVPKEVYPEFGTVLWKSAINEYSIILILWSWHQSVIIYFLPVKLCFWPSLINLGQKL